MTLLAPVGKRAVLLALDRLEQSTALASPAHALALSADPADIHFTSKGRSCPDY